MESENGQPNMGVHSHNSSTWEAETGGCGLWSAWPTVRTHARTTRRRQNICKKCSSHFTETETTCKVSARLPAQRLSGAVRGALLEVAHSGHLHLPQAHVEGQRTDTDI